MIRVILVIWRWQRMIHLIIFHQTNIWPLPKPSLFVFVANLCYNHPSSKEKIELWDEGGSDSGEHKFHQNTCMGR